MKKIIPYIFILLVILPLGFLGVVNHASAQVSCTGAGANGQGAPVGCIGTCTLIAMGTTLTNPSSAAACTSPGVWTPNTISGPGGGQQAPPSSKTPFESQLGEDCSITSPSTWFEGCLIQLFYVAFHGIASILLWLAATFFNALVFMSINSDLTSKAAFLPIAWGVVRDLSNIFFILVLIYIAIKIVLGLAGHDGKKMLVWVIIMALLINFSMFFCQVIIDSSNVLALIFYNKINVQTAVNGVPRDYSSATGEKDMSGGMVAAFDPTKLLQPEFFEQLKTTTIEGVPQKSTKVPASTMLGIILVAGIIMLVAAYALFIGGISFLGRLVELWALIIFAPFAFMSFTLPILSGIEYIGWKSWFSRLLKMAFMAPIFTFFLYLIFLILQSNLFASLIKTQTAMQSFLSVLIPAIIILTLLLRAVKFAKASGGVVGDMAMAGMKLVGGAALGVATGGAALALTNTVGRGAASIANNDETRRKAAEGDKGAQRKLALANKFATKSFDFSQTGIGKYAVKKSGLDVTKVPSFLSTENMKGGRKGMDKRKAEKLDLTRKSYMMTPAEAQKQDGLAAIAKEKNTRAAQYEKDRDEARARVEVEGGGSFDETEFKKAYIEGGRIKELGKVVKGGLVDRTDEIKDSKTINKDRQTAFAMSLQNPDEDGKAIRKGLADYKSSFTSGMAQMVTTRSGLATTGVATALAGPLGTALAIPIGGLVIAIKDLVKDRAQANFKILGANPNIVASVRQGVKTDKDEAWHHLQEAYGGDHHEKEGAHGGGGGDHAKEHPIEEKAHAKDVVDDHGHAAEKPASGGGGDHGHA